MEEAINSLFTTTQLMSIITRLLFLWLIFGTAWLYGRALMKDPLLWTIGTIVTGVVGDVIIPSSLTEPTKGTVIIYTIVLGVVIYSSINMLVDYFKGSN